MDEQRLIFLFEQYINKTETPAEKAELMEFIAGETNPGKIHSLIDRARQRISSTEKLTDEQSARIFQEIERRNMVGKVISLTAKPSLRPWRWVAAAIITILLSAAVWTFVLNTPQKSIAVTPAKPAQDVEAPKFARPVITLASGKQVLIDSAGNGTLAMEGNVKLEKRKDGQIVYSGSNTDLQYNTLTNPRGSQVISLSLSDGSRVWLNAESSLRYPTSFHGDQRTVEITGEAYFEVAHNARMPFQVKKGQVGVEVLGTHFNVNAYDDEPGISITLLEGSVRIANGSSHVLIKPGEQARVSAGIAVDKDVDITAVMAWKNGLFSFSGSDLKTIMRQVSRWYDVDIVFEKEINEKFFAEISRDISAASLFNILEETKSVTFRIEGRTVFVQPAK